MEITIIGWYGTETIGDRAILAGIFRLLSLRFPTFSIRLGSLYPFYTERTLSEDLDFYKSVSDGKMVCISIFDSMNPWQLKKNIKESNLLVVGGGPLMDLTEMNMLEYAFCYAKRKKVKSLLFGCGWGPLKNPNIIERAGHIVGLSNYAIFRDETSVEQCLKHFPCFSGKVSSSIDPAVFACHYFRINNRIQRKEDFIAVNFRDVLLEGRQYAENSISKEIFINVLKGILSQTEIPIRLIPMHNFFIGGDDRVFLNSLKERIPSPNIIVAQEPMSLSETMECFYHAKACVGMRFHSILLQTILNGNNYILDYTDPQTGKIIGLIKQLGLESFYENRYCSIYNTKDRLKIDVNCDERYHYSEEFVLKGQDKFLSVLNSICLV